MKKMTRMILHLNFITPLWTADASGEAHHVEGTGLVGSLRWWYEALIRGMGGWACDPSDAEERCPQGDAVTAENVEEVLCPACQLFGATGWAKTFNLALSDGTSDGFPPTGHRKVTTTEGRKNPWGKPSAWYFDAGRSGPVNLALVSRRAEDEMTLILLLGLAEFIRRHAALGSKTNLGYGLFDWAREPRPLNLVREAFGALMGRQAGSGRRGGRQRWPDLREMFFAQVSLISSWEPKDFVNFKYDMRAAFREGKTIKRLVADEEARRELRHFLLGTVKGSSAPQASKVKMALLPPDQRTLRLWGWVPSDLPGGVQREEILKLLHRQIGFRAERDIVRWREFDSSRDTVKRSTDSVEYLNSLMEGER